MIYQFFNLEMQAANDAPVAVVSPDGQAVILGVTVSMDGRASYDPQGDPITYEWGFTSVPIGSELDATSFTLTLGDASMVSFVPDIVGLYTVGLVVSDGQFLSQLAQATVSAEAIQSPVCTDRVPDGAFFFKIISDFWKRVEHTEGLAVAWSAYIQATAADLLEGLQAGYNKSISTALDLHQRRWLQYLPTLGLSAEQSTLVIGNLSDGISATTGALGSASLGVILSSTSLQVLEGSVRESFTGKTLQIFDSNGLNGGDYTISRVENSLDGYRVSASTPFPDVAGDTIAAANDLVVNAASDVVTSVAVDFTVPVGFGVGDVLRILTGPNIGLYRVVEVAPGADPHALRVDTLLPVADLAAQFTVLNTVTAVVPQANAAFTDVVHVPITEADLTVLQSPDMSGQAEIVGIREIRVDARFVFEAATGRQITIIGGANSGQFPISSVTSSGTGYEVNGMFVGPYPQTVTFSLEGIGSPDGRVIIVGGRAHTLLRSRNDLVQPGPPIGPGPVSMAVLDQAELPSVLSGVEWRVPATLTSNEYNFEDMGVSSGDLLVLRVANVTTGKFAEVSCTVVGADRNRVGFVLGTQPVGPGAVPDLTDQEKYDLAVVLGIAGATLDASGVLSLTARAQMVEDARTGLPFALKYFNVPLSPSSLIEAGGHAFQLSAVSITRNLTFAVDDTVVSIPCLKEYIDAPTTGINADGTFEVFAKDGSSKTVAVPPISFRENSEYIVDAEADIFGTDGAATAGTSVFESVTGYFLSRNVDVGDTVTVGAEEFSVVAVLSETQLEVVHGLTGEPFSTDLVGVKYSLTRRVPGRFVRFLGGIFSVTSPAPDALWAEVSFLDNSQTLENNFGLMVSLTEEQLTSQGTSSTTYREAVLGLMYAWSTGPKMASIKLGANILGGVPVADVYGKIIDLDRAFKVDPITGDPVLGRLLVQDLDPATDRPTGITRIYFYRPLVAGELEAYSGLEENPETGRTYQVGDTLQRFAPIGKGILVVDYVDDEDIVRPWWLGKVLQGDPGAELQKYHSWRVKTSVDALTSVDIELINEFAHTIRPAWTYLDTIAVKGMVDDITIEDDLFLGMRVINRDDPFGSLEATAIISNDNGGGYMLQHAGVSPLSTRVTFNGHDLETPAGGAGPLTFTSARGGFIDPLAVGPNPAFPLPIAVNHGAPLVRAGDLLYIPKGENKGWYEVAAPTGVDTDLSIIQCTVTALDCPPVTGVQAATDQEFSIFRRSINPITVGITDAFDGSNVVTDTGKCFFTEGVAVDDLLVITEALSPARGTYRITEVIDPGLGVFPWAQLRVEPIRHTTAVPPAGAGGLYQIRREALLTNPLSVGTTLNAGAGPPHHVATDAAGVFDLESIQTYDELVIEDTAAAGVYQILKVQQVAPPGVDLYVRPALPDPAVTPWANATYHIRREGIQDASHALGGGGGLYLDQVVEFFPYELLNLTILQPKQEVLAAIVDVSAAGTEFTSAAGGFAGSLVGDFIEVASGSNVGVYEVTGIVGLPNVVDVDPVQLTVEVAGPAVRVLRNLADFHVDGVSTNIVSLNSGPGVGDFVSVGTAVGDTLEIFDGTAPREYIIAEVNFGGSSETIRLTEAVSGTPGPGQDVTGRVIRRTR